MTKEDKPMSKRAERRKEYWKKRKGGSTKSGENEDQETKEKLPKSGAKKQTKPKDTTSEVKTTSAGFRQSVTLDRLKTEIKATKLKNQSDDEESDSAMDTDDFVIKNKKAPAKTAPKQSDSEKAANEDADKSGPKKKKKKKYFVLFVGNLPYDTTGDALREHFTKFDSRCKIKDIRLLTDKVTKASRGCGYVEFDDANCHKNALQLHHTLFNDRQINVEFTAPGRKSKLRDEKIKEKNKNAARFRANSKEDQMRKWEKPFKTRRREKFAQQS